MSTMAPSAEQHEFRPRRLLLVTGDMGEGHNATARGIEEAVRRLWPECEIRWVDTLEVMGRGVGPAFRWIYVTNVQETPALYELFYGSLWRRRWFAAASKEVVATWSGRGLAAVVDSYDPDLIISTYHLGNAGLGWLRRNRGLRAAIAAWVVEFAPHPLWIYPELDIHYVMHERGIPLAEAAGPGAKVAVSAAPVTDAYAPQDRGAAREMLDLPADAFIALLSCGSLAFGAVEDAVRTLLNTDRRVQVVAVCGRNEDLRQRLARWGYPRRRLRVLGWTDEMPTYLAASDVVVTNGSGMTAIEAVSCGRVVVMFAPIAAHGRANAALLTECGLAVLCRDPDDLARETRRMIDEPSLRAGMEAAALAHSRARTRAEDLRAVASLAGARQIVRG